MKSRTWRDALRERRRGERLCWLDAWILEELHTQQERKRIRYEVHEERESERDYREVSVAACFLSAYKRAMSMGLTLES